MNLIDCQMERNGIVLKDLLEYKNLEIGIIIINVMTNILKNGFF